MISIPAPMQNPCAACEKAQSCLSAETYQCEIFRAAFIRSWDETTGWLRQQLMGKEGA